MYILVDVKDNDLLCNITNMLTADGLPFVVALTPYDAVCNLARMKETRHSLAVRGARRVLASSRRGKVRSDSTRVNTQRSDNLLHTSPTVVDQDHHEPSTSMVVQKSVNLVPRVAAAVKRPAANVGLLPQRTGFGTPNVKDHRTVGQDRANLAPAANNSPKVTAEPSSSVQQKPHQMQPRKTEQRLNTPSRIANANANVSSQNVKVPGANPVNHCRPQIRKNVEISKPVVASSLEDSQQSRPSNSDPITPQPNYPSGKHEYVYDRDTQTLSVRQNGFMYPVVPQQTQQNNLAQATSNNRLADLANTTPIKHAPRNENYAQLNKMHSAPSTSTESALLRLLKLEPKDPEEATLGENLQDHSAVGHNSANFNIGIVSQEHPEPVKAEPTSPVQLKRRRLQSQETEHSTDILSNVAGTSSSSQNVKKITKTHCLPGHGQSVKVPAAVPVKISSPHVRKNDVIPIVPSTKASEKLDPSVSDAITPQPSTRFGKYEYVYDQHTQTLSIRQDGVVYPLPTANCEKLESDPSQTPRTNLTQATPNASLANLASITPNEQTSLIAINPLLNDLLSSSSPAAQSTPSKVPKVIQKDSKQAALEKEKRKKAILKELEERERQAQPKTPEKVAVEESTAEEKASVDKNESTGKPEKKKRKKRVNKSNDVITKDRLFQIMSGVKNGTPLPPHRASPDPNI